VVEYGAVWHQIIRDGVMLFVVIDPIGSLSLFLGVTPHTTPEQRRKLAFRCYLYSAVILVR
jgi:multiple antibiotic resistance protein